MLEGGHDYKPTAVHAHHVGSDGCSFGQISPLQGQSYGKETQGYCPGGGREHNQPIYAESSMDRGDGGTNGHFANFIDAVRKHDASILNAPIETGHLSSGLAHLGNIAYRMEKVLTFNPQSEKFVNDPEADKMLTRNYRKGFEVPNQV